MSRILFAVAFAAVLGTLTGAARPADEKYVKLVHVETGKVLSTADQATDIGAKTVVAKDGDDEAHQWSFVKDAGFYKVVNRKSGRCLDVDNSHCGGLGSAVQLWDCLGDGSNKQTNQWYELIRDDFLPRPINQ